MIIDGVEITFEGFIPLKGEAENYLSYVRERIPNVSTVNVRLCDDGMVDVSYSAHSIPFEHIRRITGYLTGDLTSWNDSKKSEEQDRVKHL